MKTQQDDVDEEEKKDAISENHVSINDEQQFILIRQDIADLREELVKMINSNKNKTYDQKRRSNSSKIGKLSWLRI